MPSQPAFPFRYRHELTGKWVRARWKATAEEIAERGGEITGPAEIIEDLCGSGFQPYRLMTHAELVTASRSRGGCGGAVA